MKFIETEGRLEATRGLGEGEWGVNAHGYRVSVGVIKRIWK